MLDLEARNEALLLLKAASLAETDPAKRAHWASLALHSLSRHVVNTSAVAVESRTNLMVQNIKVNQRDPPKLHKPLVKCLNKYGISFETVHPSTEIQRDMPMWHHPGENHQKRQENNGKKAKCLRGNHAAMKVGDGLDLVQRLEDPLHYKHASCMCDACEEDRLTRGCNNPHACINAAASRLGQILPKWVPIPRDGPEIVPLNEDTDSGHFQPPKGITTLTQGLRTMTHRSSELKEHPNPPTRRRAVVAPVPATTTVYIAGSVHSPARKRANAAAGLFFSPEDNMNKGKCIPVNGEQSQYAAESLCCIRSGAEHGQKLCTHDNQHARLRPRSDE
jgi:hypothetical protein